MKTFLKQLSLSVSFSVAFGAFVGGVDQLVNGGKSSKGSQEIHGL